MELSSFIGEFIGTALLLLIGNGVVANVVLTKTKGNNSGWIVITLGWAMAVFLGVYTSVRLGGSGHLNPAVTIAMSALTDFNTELLVPYLVAQFSGAFVGTTIVWIAYKQHFDETDDAASKLAVFCTGPAIRNNFFNFFTETTGTFVLVLGVMAMTPAAATLGTLDALPVALLLLGIGLSLGGPTGYALNPARDLAPRIAHFILPLKNKKDSDWSYSWIPVLAPILGALLAILLYNQVI